MNWYYVEAGQQVGPVTEADFQNLVSTGKIRGDTLVWHEGLADWKPYSQVAIAPSQPPIPGGIVCAECGNTFAPENVVRFGDRAVCANCKPLFLQKMREGVASGGAQTGQVSVEQVLARDYDVAVGKCYNDAMALYKANFGNLFGTTLAIMALIGLCSVIPFGIGGLLSLLIGGPLMGGLFLFYIRMIRGEQVSTSDAFIGFKNKSSFFNLVLTRMVSGILAGLCILPGAIMFGISFVAFIAAKRSGSAAHFQLTGVVIAGIIALVIGFGGMAYLQTSWIFALSLVADKKMGFWPAMELSRKVVSKHWWAIFGLMITIGLVCIVGVLGCCVGAIFTMPLGYAMLTQQYVHLFGDLAPAGQ